MAIVEATRKLNEHGHYGPYAVVLSPRLYSLLHRIYEKTGVLEIETIRQLASDGVYQSNRLRGDSGVVVSTGRENMDLAVAMDMVTAYLGAERMNHPFRVLEALILRIKHPDAICTLEGHRRPSAPKKLREPRPAWPRSWSSTTRRTCARCSRRMLAATATRSPSPRTASRRSPSLEKNGIDSSSPTW